MASSRQNSPASDLDDFWQEFKDIESSKEPDGEPEDDDSAKPLMVSQNAWKGNSMMTTTRYLIFVQRNAWVNCKIKNIII